MPSTIGKCKLFRIKHITLLEGKTFLRNKHKTAFFKIKCTEKWQKRKHHNIFKCNLTICLCSGKTKGYVFNLANILPKYGDHFLLLFVSESHWKIVKSTVIFLWVYNSNLKKSNKISLLKADKELNAILHSFLMNIVDVRVLCV